MCGYENPGKPIPRIRALVFLGKMLSDTSSTEVDEYEFQEPQMYFVEDITDSDIKEQVINETEGSGKVIIPYDCIHMIKDFDELLQWITMLRQSEGASKLYD